MKNLFLFFLQTYKYIDPEIVNKHYSEFDDVSKIIQPGIDVLGFHIMEPTTVITDLMVSVVCFYAFFKIKNLVNRTKPQYFAQIFMLMMGIAATLGGIFGHGLIHIVHPYFKIPGWYFSMFAVAFIERSAIAQASLVMAKKVGQFFLVLNMMELIILCGVTLYTLKFKFVEFHSAYGFLIVVLLFHAYNYYKTKDRGSKLMLLNTILLLITVFIYNYPVIFHTFFNHRDLAHLVMCFSIYLIYRATLQLGNKEILDVPN